MTMSEGFIWASCINCEAAQPPGAEMQKFQTQRFKTSPKQGCTEVCFGVKLSANNASILVTMQSFLSRLKKTSVTSHFPSIHNFAPI